ncbi:type II secretion system ATPase GspE [Kangiella sp. TOML190]|uniref:type II secretion system ATPase GspE n=1 Tax=Kangiella sp. TOML190 TaxID=2931351 RepID=UPI00203AFF62|nr:type II secretion system ATPase GspE [Kangiella sp. TOML190]
MSEQLLSEPVETVEVELASDSFRPLPFSFAKRHGVFLTHTDAGLQCFLREGTSPQALLEVKRYYDGSFQIQKLNAEDFESQLSAFYQSGTGGAQQAMDDLGDEMDLFKLAEELPETEDLLEAEDDAPIIKLINALLTEAIKENASDIHIETFEKTLSVRFRVDGVLREVLQPSRKLAPLLVSRIKVMAKLDIAEKRIPQDGRIALRIASRAVDVRVSTMPSSHGERVVLRLLDKEAGRLEFSHLGMQQDTMDLMSGLLHKPHGIILVTGPTGSGKTTTLYAGLSLLNNASRNILTVEDPIEYLIDGIGQTQVNPKVDMTFARGLRAILRQDPDVVMVGEIRDLETAQIAVQASLTGHLVLSTLHTNTAVGAVTRMQDMGVEPFLLSSSVLGVLAQRLVRRLCGECKTAAPANAKECELMGFEPQQAPIIHHPKGCEACNYRGYNGRQGIYELVVIDEQMRTMIHNNASEQEMERHARKSTPSIRADGRDRILQGITTVEEVLRVTRED